MKHNFHVLYAALAAGTFFFIATLPVSQALWIIPAVGKASAAAAFVMQAFMAVNKMLNQS